MRRLATRSIRRGLSTAAVAAEEEAPRGKLVPTLAAASSISAAAGAVVYMGSKRFVDSAEFRTDVRRDHAQVAQWVEDVVLREYAPTSWAKQIRIEDDLAQGSQLEELSAARLSGLNIGTAPFAPATMSQAGQQFFMRFSEPPAAAEPTVAVSSEAAVSASERAVATALFSPPKGDASPTLALAPIAPDDADSEAALSLGGASAAAGDEEDFWRPGSAAEVTALRIRCGELEQTVQALHRHSMSAVIP